MSILLTSPGLLYAVRAPGARAGSWWLLGAAVAVLIPTLLYYGGGWLQYGYRYFLDSIPFVIALCGLAAALDERRLAEFGIGGPAIGVGWRWLIVLRRRRRARRRVLGVPPLNGCRRQTTGRNRRRHATLPPCAIPDSSWRSSSCPARPGSSYEIVWSRQLVLVFGNTTQAVSAILTGFFGGMAIGSVVGGRIADRVRSPLRMYGAARAGPRRRRPRSRRSRSGCIHEVYRGIYRRARGDAAALALVRFGLARARARAGDGADGRDAADADPPPRPATRT